MLVLGIDSSAVAASAAVAEDGRLLGEFYMNTKQTHSQTLLSMVQGLLQSLGKSPGDFHRFAVTHGPGSFTGVRIGMAAAKGFAWGGNIPCYGVSTLEAMAEHLGVYEGYVCPCMDARRSQVYNALFRAEGGKLTRLAPDRAISLAELEGELKALDGPIFLVGDGSLLCRRTLSLPNLVLPPEHRMHQRADGVAILAARKIAAGEPGDAAALVPNYLRLSQAERERLEREQSAARG